MLVKITKKHTRALDPRTIVNLNEGHIEDFEERVAKSIIDNGFGIQHKELKVVIENKAIFEAPENKQENIKSTENNDPVEKKGKKK